MNTVLKNTEDRMGKSIKALENEFSQLRTGRANASLFDKIQVEYYGSLTPLNQVASVSIPEARLVVIQPWDKTVLDAIEKAILKSELGLNPSNDGKVLRVSFPALTEERRKELAKNAKQTSESTKVSIRNIRRDAIDELKKMEKNSDITEDDLKLGETKVQKLTDQFIAQIDEVYKAKEKEIMEI